MAFTEEDLAYLRKWLGSTVNEDTNPAVVEDLEARYDRLDSLPAVVAEVLRQRLADLADWENNPAQYAISGEYSQDIGGNIDFLKSLLAQLEQEEGLPGGSVLVAVQPSGNRWRPQTCYPRRYR